MGPGLVEPGEEQGIGGMMEIAIVIAIVFIVLFIIGSFKEEPSESSQTSKPVFQAEKKPQWVHLSKIVFGDGGPLKKPDAKRGFRDYLIFCGFSKDYIADAMEDFSERFNIHFEELRADIAETKEDIKDFRESIRELKKQKKLDKSEGKLKGEELREALENADEEIESSEEDLKELENELPKMQSEMKAIKADWKPYLLKYIEDNTSYGWVLENKPHDFREA